VGVKLFGVDVAKVVAQAMPAGNKGLPAATLRKFTAGATDPNNLTAGPTYTSADYATRGFAQAFRLDQVDGRTVLMGDKKVLLLGEPLFKANVQPAPNDRVIVGGETLVVIRVLDRDPASATWSLQCRGP